MVSAVTGKVNRSICSKCGKIVESQHLERDGKVYLQKNCLDCGSNEALVSANSSRWRSKREACGYDEKTAATCSLNCPSCDHGKKPTLVFLDVTNRCNMNCPICLANIPAMGFQFDPPMAYFEKVFRYLAQIEPKPKIQLFGGEPTVRNDLVDIIRLAKHYGMQARVVTNGLKLADADYCRKLLATGTQLMFAFDGRSPEIYQRIRKSNRSYELKMKALENIKKFRKSKITIMCATGKGVNDEYLADLVDFCHEGRDYIAALDLIPLVASWGPEQVDAVNTTIEDVERMMSEAVPGMDFVPAGMLLKIQSILDAFGMKRITFGGAHPNCESVSLLISDGNRYHPVARYLKRPFEQVIAEAVERDEALGRKLQRSLIAKWGGSFGKKILAFGSLYGLARKSVDFRQVFGGSALKGMGLIAWGLLRGRKAKTVLRQYTKCAGILRIIILPFEEAACVESARLVECPTSFAYEHPETRQIRLMPVCAWPIYKNSMLRAASENYGLAPKEKAVPLDAAI